MLSHTIITISENNWWIIGSNIATAVATCIAVITTLILTYRQQAQRLKAHSSLTVVLSVGPRNSNVQLGSQEKSSFTLSITNVGLRHVTIKNITFEILDSSKKILWSSTVINNKVRLEQDQEEYHSLASSKIPEQHFQKLRDTKRSYKHVRWRIISTAGKEWVTSYNNKEGKLLFNMLRQHHKPAHTPTPLI